MEEELLTENRNRYVVYPIKYDDVWKMYKTAESAFWTAEEVDLSKDIDDWENKLSDNERYFIKHILAFFAASDGIVNENLAGRFLNDVMIPEAKSFYAFQIAMETIHCVSGNTQILCESGYFRIKDLINEEVFVWNGDEFSEVTVQYTGDSELCRVKLSNGMELECTPDHKWWIGEERSVVFTKDLVVGDVISPYKLPVINPRDSDPVSRAVPINSSLETKINWLAQLSPFEVKYIEKSFAKDIQLMLTTIGVNSIIEEDHEDSWLVKLYITTSGLCALEKLGYNSPIPREKHHDCDGITVVSVEKLDGIHPTYCFNEPLRHSGVFNGILTGQSEMYSLMIDTYIKQTQEKLGLFNAVQTIPCIKQKAEWAQKWIADQDSSFAKRLIAFAVVEGVFFSGAFCSIFWLKERGLMPGLCTSNEFISRDESLHTEFAILLYSKIKNRLSQEEVHDLMKEAVGIEIEFIVDSIPCNLLGMNSGLMQEYIKFVADRLLVQLGYDQLYETKNPFPFMDRINLGQKTNFFENRESSYAKAKVGQNNVYEFSLEDAF